MACSARALRRFCSINKHLIALKLVVFFVHGGIFSLVPFLNEQAKHLGFPFPETALFYGVILLCSVVGPPVIGLIADKVSNFKLVFSGLLVVTLLSHNFFLLIPGTSFEDHPAEISVMFTRTGSYIFSKVCDFPSTHCPTDEKGENLRMAFHSCQILCKDPNESVYLEVDPAKLINTSISGANHSEPSFCYRKSEGYTRADECQPFARFVKTLESFTILSSPQIYMNREKCVSKIMLASWERNSTLHSPNCPDTSPGCSRILCDALLLDGNGSDISCPNQLGQPTTTQNSYVVLRMLCLIFVGATVAVLEAGIFVKIKAHDAYYGNQRVWGYLAQAILVPLSRYFIDLAGSYGGPNYFPAFVFFDVFVLAAFIVTLSSLSVEMHPMYRRPSIEKSGFRHQFKALFLFCSVSLLGAVATMLNHYIPPFLIHFGCPEFDLNAIHNIGRFACLPIIFFVDPILKTLGRINILIGCFMSFAIQIFCHIYIQDPPLSLALEVVRYITVALIIAASMTLTDEIAPQKTFVTVMAIVYSLHTAAGSAVGLLTAKYITLHFSTYIALREFGIISCAAGFISGCIYFFCKIYRLCRTDDSEGMIHLAQMDSYKPPEETKVFKIDALWNPPSMPKNTNSISYQKITDY